MLDAPVLQAELFSAVATAAPRVQPDGLPVKVTVRMSATHAVTLATRAHSADVSQGAYVAGLLDNAPPPPLPPATSHQTPFPVTFQGIPQGPASP